MTETILTVAEADAILAETFSHDAWNALEDAKKEQMLINATHMVDLLLIRSGTNRDTVEAADSDGLKQAVAHQAVFVSVNLEAITRALRDNIDGIKSQSLGGMLIQRESGYLKYARLFSAFSMGYLLPYLRAGIPMRRV